ncbi:riboflavin biosynthesis protein RibA [Luteimonas sp. SJ-92]|uniref:Riboflavin biosynthesis protein RibA n=1 Tax=Luteimonas salinisoli TaxID=2752307 RepID=A0A853JES5_9GAMM|nr:riboflavin biosynthesis protein RibA [Luteimonas salinisoli]NZA27109.1 riboflavin biosynthesis protein RibA [Luteimonas salinisoli]
MSAAGGLTGEASDHKVAAAFGSVAAAQAAATGLHERLALAIPQVRVVEPGQAGLARALEPEDRGIFRTILRSHLWLGIAGAVLGGVVFAILWGIGLPLITQSPAMAAGAIVGFGAVAGLFAGGLVSLRPDHDPYVIKAREAHAAGLTVLLVHATSAEQCAQAQELLEAAGGDTMRTL